MPDHFKRLSEPAINWIKTVVFILALIPFIRLLVNGLNDNLGANPVEKILRNTGFWSLTLLTLTLAVTPLRRVTQWIWVGRFRRMLGLFTFFYVCLHFSTWLVLDQYFDWAEILKDIGKRPYITIGFTAFLLLIPLAVTSTDSMLKRLGGERWRRLHSLVYLIAFGGIIHFWWLVKKDITEPLIFAVLFVISMSVRAGYGRHRPRLSDRSA